MIPISILNLDEEPKQLSKGYTIGVMEQVERAPPRDGIVLPIPEDGPEQQERVLDLVLKYQGIFALPNGELGHTTLVQHTVDTGDRRPIKQPPRTMPLPRERLQTEKSIKCWKRATLNPVIAHGHLL